MQNPDCPPREAAVLGQKYAYATASLILGLLCFVNLAGLEKAVVAIVFGVLALRSQPVPALAQRRAWAKAGVALGAGLLVLVPALMYFVIGIDGLRQMVEALARLGWQIVERAISREFELIHWQIVNVSATPGFESRIGEGKFLESRPSQGAV